jgi:hypothetical protein
LIERLSADGFQSINLSKKVLTRQFIVAQQKFLQCRAESEFRRNVACAARRSFLDVGTLGNHPINLSKKYSPVKWLTLRPSFCSALQRPNSVGMLPAQQEGHF